MIVIVFASTSVNHTLDLLHVSSLRPADRAALSWASRKPYAAIIARQNEMNDEALDAAYLQASADDDVTPPDALRNVAYNDVLNEKGADPTHAIPLSRGARIVALFA